MKILRAHLSRLTGLFTRARREKELAAELEANLALHIEDNLRAGMPPEEARRQALVKLGGLEQTKHLYREQNGIPWLERLFADFRYAFRMFHRNRASALAIIVLLALGIGGVTALFGPLYSLVLSPLPFPHSDRLVRIGGRIPLFNIYANTFVHPERLDPIFSAEVAYMTRSVPISAGARPALVQYAAVTPGFFATFGVQPRLGKNFDRLDPDAHVMVVSDRFWHNELHASPQAVGKLVQAGALNFEILGVMPPGFDFPNGTDIWVLMNPGGTFDTQLVGRLRSGLSLDRAATKLESAGFNPGVGPSGLWGPPGPVLESLQTYLLGDRRPLLWILWGVSGLFLLLACAGSANLLLARGVRRQSEMVVRLTLGAGRGRLIRQFLTETSLLATAGALLGLGIAAAAGRWIATTLPAAQGAQSFSLANFGPATLSVLLTTILCGLAPAFHATGGDLNAFLKTGTSGITRSPTHRRFFSSHEWLAGAQLILAMVLLIGTGLLLRSLVARLNFPLGFQPKNVVVVEARFPIVILPAELAARNFQQEHHLDAAHSVPPTIMPELQRLYRAANDARQAYYDPINRQVVERLNQLPGVISAAFFGHYPFQPSLNSPGSGTTFFKLNPQTHSYRGAVHGFEAMASPGAFRVLGIRLLAGRSFSSNDPAEYQSAVNLLTGPQQPPPAQVAIPCIVNEALAKRFWPGQDPIGKRFFEEGARPARVIGVVSNIRQGPAELQPFPTVYTPSWGWGGLAPSAASYVVKLRPGISTKQFGDDVTGALIQILPNMPRPKVSSLEELTTASLANLRLTLALLACFALLGIAVAALGVYAAATLLAAARTREMGIRIALGAHADQIRSLAVYRSLRLILVALPLGALCAWGLARSLSHWLFQVGAADPITYLASAGLLALIALAAGFVPARRAARVDPVVALREE